MIFDQDKNNRELTKKTIINNEQHSVKLNLKRLIFNFKSCANYLTLA